MLTTLSMSLNSCWYFGAFYIKSLTNACQGPSTSTYGALRASLGYPDPFTLNYVEIGNEDFLHNGIPTYNGMFHRSRIFLSV